MTPSADVVAAAQAADRLWGVFASFQIAQFADESDWGRKATGAFNFFGVKASAAQPGVLCHTHEVVDGRLVPKLCRFRLYASLADAFDEHARLIATDRRYSPAMALKADLAAFVRAVAKIYATDPHYADKILELIRADGLERYDTASVASAPAAPAAVARLLPQSTVDNL